MGPHDRVFCFDIDYSAVPVKDGTGRASASIIPHYVSHSLHP